MVGVGLLVIRSMESIRAGDAMRHEIVAERIFDAMEGELTALIEEEEARSFLEYRFFYDPDGGSDQTTVRSPLSRPSSFPFVLGYFQLEPDGSLRSPRRPRDEARAAAAYSWAAAEDLEEEEGTLEALTAGLRDEMEQQWDTLQEQQAQELAERLAQEAKQRRVPDPKPVRSKKKQPRKAKKKEPPKVQAVEKAPSKGLPTQRGYLDSLNKAGRKRTERSTKSEPVSTDNAYFQLEEPQEADLPQVEAPQQIDEAVASLPPRKQKAKSPFRLPSLGRRSAEAPRAEPVAEQAASAERESTEDDEDAEDGAPAFAEDTRTVPGAVVAQLDQAPVEPNDREQAEGFADAKQDRGAVEGPGDANKDVVEGGAAVAGEAQLASGEAAPVVDETAQGALADIAPADDEDFGEELDDEDAWDEPAKEATVASSELSRAGPSSPKQAELAPSDLFTRPAEPGQVDVSISPLRGTRVDEDHLVLHRTVSVGELTWSQGLVLRVSELVAYVQQEALGEELASFVDLRWGAMRAHGPMEPTPRQTFRFSHRFEEPFTSLSTTALLRRLPPDGPDAQAWVMALSLALGLVGLLGFAGLYRMVAVVVHFAERRSNFVAAVSHELKTPLTAIRMYGEILREGMVPNDEKRQEYYGTITAEAERLSRLIDNVLELSRLEKGTRSMHITVGSIQPVVEEVVRILRPHARSQGFVIEVELADGLPPVAYDRDALQQILINLVDNALKFARSSEEKVVVLACELVGDELMLRVRDRGPGMPAVQVGKIFQPFFRGERELTRSTKGTGIGLALVQGLAEGMGGRVVARNHPAGGFEVSVALAAA